MSRHKILFPCENNDDKHLEVKTTDSISIVVSIEDFSCDHQFNYQHVVLDKATAIKLTRVLKSEISKIKS